MYSPEALLVKRVLTMFSFLAQYQGIMSLLRVALLPSIALLAGVLLVAGTASAQCRLCDTPTTTPDVEGESVPIRLDIQARLDFDQLILRDSSIGTARLSPDGSSSSSGSIETMSGRAMVGSVIVTGEPGRLVRIGFPGAIELTSLSGSAIRLTNLTSDLPTAARLDSAGQLTFRFGGEIALSGNVDGAYRGDIPITVDYL